MDGFEIIRLTLTSHIEHNVENLLPVQQLTAAEEYNRKS